MTITGNAEAEDDEAPGVLAVLVKQLALDGLPAEMKAFLIERKCFHMDMSTFQATGGSYQKAHGRRKVAEKQSVAPPVQHSAQCLGVSAKQAKKDLAKMGKTYDRRAYVRNEKLCYLCLCGGHLAEQCQPNPGCSKCDGKHHTLLHGKPKPKPVKDRDESIIQFYRIGTGASHDSCSGSMRQEAGTSESLSGPRVTGLIYFLVASGSHFPQVCRDRPGQGNGVRQ